MTKLLTDRPGCMMNLSGLGRCGRWLWLATVLVLVQACQDNTSELTGPLDVVNPPEQGGTRANDSILTVITALAPPSSCLRTVNASTVSEFTSALSHALPGDCILLAAGTYSLNSTLTIKRSGIADAPIVVQGAGSSTVIDVNKRGVFVDASYFQLRRLRLTNFNTVGLWLRGVTGVVIDSVEVDHTLQEAVALKYGSHHNIVKNSLFHDTGILYPQYGEGISVGGKTRDGLALDFGATDNQVLNNHFGPNVRTAAVLASEGADRTLIRGNFFDGENATWVPLANAAFVSVIANDVTIDSNFMRFGHIHGVSFIKPVTRTM
ncbi:MAG: right-handed parallel beta-helix repeat-containing protein, partial [Actinomycetota bacterium]|nr:right-handed parallel beta-helix repeat-containing protein [Actinomycetota bacterium]